MFTNELVKNCVRSLEGKILDRWVRAETKEGQLYYLNHEHKISQWDHPEYIKMMKEISVINSLKYAAYRTAFKLRYLQTRLKCHEISLECISAAFNKADFLPEKNTRYISNKEIENILLICYKTTFKHKHVDTHLCTDLLLNMLINTFDENRSGKIQILKSKVFLVVMGGGRLQEKYRYLFNEIADDNHHVSRKKLAKLLLILSSMVEFLSEEVYFGSSFVSGAVESCFINASENVGIRENAFLDWVLQEPQTLLWWSTLYRISMAELVCHDVKCSTCKEKPIIGMRYQCLRCLGYNLCQDCFLHGRNSKNHKFSHPLLEYCQESTGGEWGKSLLKIMHHHLKFKHSLVKPRYLSISSSDKTSSLLQDSKDDSFSSEILELNENAVPCKTNVSDVSNPNQTSIDITAFLTTENLNNESNRISELLTTPNYFKPRDELQSVIKHLEDGEKLLSRKLSNCNDCDKPLPLDLIEQHREELQTQINRLKNIFYTYSQSPKTKSAKISSGKGPFLPRFESTPVVSDRGLHPVLSPIETFSNSNEILFGRENSHDEKSKQSIDISSHSFHSEQKSFVSSEEEGSLSTFTQKSLQNSNESCTTMKNNESVMYSTEVSSIDLNYKDDNSSCSKQFSRNIPKISDIITNKEEEEEDCSSPKLSSQESMEKKFTNLERELQQLLENIDEMFKSLAIEDSAIDPSIVSGVSEIIDSFICSSDTLSEVND